ncbi:MAG: antibiotic biosynthesis monooxygenase [Salaquimonas sp.]|nr:antibiotic biosynthesis monooxygenase [Salaquimonas sp.]
MLIVTGITEVHADDIEKVLPAAAAMAAATRAEDGCITYAFYQDIENPGRFRVYEEWRDQAALDAHFRSPHMAEFGSAMQAARILGRDIVKYEAGSAEKL